MGQVWSRFAAAAGYLTQNRERGEIRGCRRARADRPVDRDAALLRPVDVLEVEQQRELVNDQRQAAAVNGIFAAQEIRPQARVLATDRGIRCVTLNYDTMRGIEPENTLF